MDFRKTFDRIPEDFDKYRPRYREEVFQELTSVCKLDLFKAQVFQLSEFSRDQRGF